MNHRVSLAILLLASILAFGSCAALQPPSATGPRANSVYPLLLTEDTHRREAVTAAVNRLAQLSGGSNNAGTELQPVTATIQSLPQRASGSLYLPKVGATAVMNEEETRESLRRFIKDWQELIGSDPAKLSLVERIDQPDGSKLANYEQRPFRYPIRGNYGKLQIHFASDRRVLDLSSTCIPDADRLQAAFSALNVRPKAEDAVKRLRDNGLMYPDAQGNKINAKLPDASEIKPRGLVIYVLPPKNETLELHLAWETDLSNAPVKIAYIDAISGETLAVE